MSKDTKKKDNIEDKNIQEINRAKQSIKNASINAKREAMIDSRKLLSDYEKFYNIRTKDDMPTPAACQICSKKYKKEDRVFICWDKNFKEKFICDECNMSISKRIGKAF